jgi:Fur family transcriptional regulator, ferric uptake regulator
MEETERWLELLEVQGSRLTGPRRLLVELIANADRALSPLELFEIARSQYPKMGLTTVYRTLELLSGKNLVQRIHHSEECNYYLRSTNGHEHVMLCSKCGRTAFFAGDDLEELIEKVGKSSGFQIQGHWLQLNGLCKSCQGY